MLREVEMLTTASLREAWTVRKALERSVAGATDSGWTVGGSGAGVEEGGGAEVGAGGEGGGEEQGG
jgi:hypothetical protein